MRRVTAVAVASALSVAGLVATAGPSPAAVKPTATGVIVVGVGAQGVTATGQSTLPSAGVIIARSGQTTTITALEEFAAPEFQLGAGCVAISGGVACSTAVAAVIADFGATTQGVELQIQSGSELATTFTGGSGNDAFYGAAGADSAQGGPGNDDLFGGPGNDSLAGDAGDDRVEGEEGNDALFAGTGNDDLVSAEETVAEKDNLVRCGDASGSDTLDIDPLLDVTSNCQGVGSIAAPGQPSVTGSILPSGDANVNADWTASPRAAGYQVDYSFDAGSTWTSIGRVSTPRLSWNAGPRRGSLILRVSAVTSSAVSSGVQSKPVTLGTAPGIPTGISAQGQADAETLVNSITLRWKAPTTGEPATQFEIQYRDCTSTCQAWVSATVTGEATVADYTVDNPGSYEIRIRSVGSTGLTSSWVTTSVSVPTGPVSAVTAVNAWGSATSFRVLWSSSSLARKWLKGYRIQMQYNDPNGTVSQWEDVKQTTGSSTTTLLTAKSLGTKAGDLVRFRVFAVPVYGPDSRASNASPRRQQTDDVPAPTDFAATYDATTDWLTMTWKNPPITTKGGANIGGYNFAYMWPGSTTWTQLGTPLSYDNERAVFSLEDVPRGTFKVRIQSIGWPDSLYSEWTITRSIRK